MAKYPDLGSVGGATSLEEIQKVYLDTMDNIMNCAVDRMKYQLNREIISWDALGWVKLPDPIISVFEQLNQRIQSQLKQNKCLNPTDDGDVTQSKKLLDSLMYEECVGQYYKLYYANVVRNNLGTGLAGKQVTTVMEIKESSRALLGKIAGEASVSQATISDAMEMYMPISETYVPHVLLEVIRMQLLEIKRYMSIELTAMKYLFSKAVYAQKAAE